MEVILITSILPLVLVRQIVDIGSYKDNQNNIYFISIKIILVNAMYVSKYVNLFFAKKKKKYLY